MHSSATSEFIASLSSFFPSVLAFFFLSTFSVPSFNHIVYFVSLHLPSLLLSLSNFFFPYQQYLLFCLPTHSFIAPSFIWLFLPSFSYILYFRCLPLLSLLTSLSTIFDLSSISFILSFSTYFLASFFVYVFLQSFKDSFYFDSFLLPSFFPYLSTLFLSSVIHIFFFVILLHLHLHPSLYTFFLPSFNPIFYFVSLLIPSLLPSLSSFSFHPSTISFISAPYSFLPCFLLYLAFPSILQPYLLFRLLTHSFLASFFI